VKTSPPSKLKASRLETVASSSRHRLQALKIQGPPFKTSIMSNFQPQKFNPFFETSSFKLQALLQVRDFKHFLQTSLRDPDFASGLKPSNFTPPQRLQDTCKLLKSGLKCLKGTSRHLKGVCQDFAHRESRQQHKCKTCQLHSSSRIVVSEFQCIYFYMNRDTSSEHHSKQKHNVEILPERTPENTIS
jgi:hypothetical protein